MKDTLDTLVHPVVLLAGAGLVAGLGQLLASPEKLTARIVVGRALSSMALGVTAGTALSWLPQMPIEALMGLACLIASLGTSGLERLLQKFLEMRK